MALRIQVNPVLAHLTGYSGWRSLKLTVWLTVGLSLVILLVVAYQMALIPDLLKMGPGRTWGYPEPPRAILVETEAIRVMFLFTPLIAACAAAVITGRYLRSDLYKMLFVTPVESRVITQGLVLRALYRLRIMLVLMVILTPVLVIRPYFDNQKMARYGCYVFISLDDYRQWNWDAEGLSKLASSNGCINPADNRLLLKSLVDTALPTVAWWGITLLGVVLGVTLMLAWHRVEAVALFVVAVPVVLIFALAALGPQIGPMMMMCTNKCTSYAVWPPAINLYEVIGVIAPYALGLVIMWASRRWVRKPE